MKQPVSAYKSLAPNEYTITPFRTYASHTYTYVSGGLTNSVDVQILRGVQHQPNAELRVENDEQELYDSVVQTFYSPIPYAEYGIQSGSSYQPSGSVFVVSITQDIFGERVQPGTFSVSIGTSSSIDDGHGNLIISESGTGYVIGSIFYDKGIALLQPTQSIVNGGLTKNGICIVNGTQVQVKFTSSVMLLEHNIRIRLNPTDFLYSVYNPSADAIPVTGSTATPLQMMVSQSLYPYITSIGLYNQYNELLAVAKLSNPIQRTDYTTQTFVVKFDT
jgi:hypothetical protein